MTSTDSTLRNLEAYLVVPFRRGGRSMLGIDCLGITLVVLELLGVPPALRPDPWGELERLWREHGSAEALASSGFPDGWERLVELPVTPPDGLVVLTRPAGIAYREVGVGATFGGRIWTATPGAGVVTFPWLAVMPDQVWRLIA